MRTNSKHTAILIIAAGVIIGGIFFFREYYPIDTTSPRTLVTRENETMSGFWEIATAPPCRSEEGRLHLDEEATKMVVYRNPEKGLSFKVPYNPQWGAPDFRFNPFDESKEAMRFGRIYISGCDGWGRIWSLRFMAAENAQALYNRLESERTKCLYESERPIECPYEELSIHEIGGKKVVRDSSYPFGTGAVTVIGEKYNYAISYGPIWTTPQLLSPTKDKIESVIESMQFID